MIYTNEALEKREYYYYPKDFDVKDINALNATFDELEQQPISTPRDLLGMLYQLSELMSLIARESNELFYQSMRDTTDTNARLAVNDFNRSVSGLAQKRYMAILKRYYEHPLRSLINQDFFRQVNKSFEILFSSALSMFPSGDNREQDLIPLYREKVNNISFATELSICLFKDSSILFTEQDSLKRHVLWNTRKDALMGEREQLHQMLDGIIKARVKRAQQAGLEHVYDLYNHPGLCYSPDHNQFRSLLDAIRKHLQPLLKQIKSNRQIALKQKHIAPWDWECDPLEAKLKPFADTKELVAKAIRILYDIRFEYGLHLDRIWNTGLLDLDYSPQKAAGQYYFGAVDYSSCRVMMNCKGSHQNMLMFFHEIGHVLQFNAMLKNPLSYMIILPHEVKEIASQALIYLSTNAWSDFYPDPQTLKNAIAYQYATDVMSLAKSVCTAEFELELYSQPELGFDQREELFIETYRKHFPLFEDDDYDEYLKSHWLLNQSIYEFPFYDIGTSLSLFAVWQLMKSFNKDKEGTMIRFHKFLQKTADCNSRELFESLGLKYDFSDAHIRKVLEMVAKELN